MGAQEEGAGLQVDSCEVIVEALIKGQGAAGRLQKLLQGTAMESGPVGNLIREIWASFSPARALMGSDQRADAAVPVTNGEKGTLDSAKKMRASSVRKSRFKRRDRPYARSRVLSKTMEDGHSWRKYGQKDILSCKFPRCYFRCTHKYDRDCQATRQVQMSEEDPSMYVITYMGEHTCSSAVNRGHGGPSFVIDFEWKAATGDDHHQSCPVRFSSSPNSLKQEEGGEEEDLASIITSGCSSSELLMTELLDMTAAEGPAAEMAAQHTSSGSEYSFCFDVGMDGQSFDFGGLFDLDQFEFF